MIDSFRSCILTIIITHNHHNNYHHVRLAFECKLGRSSFDFDLLYLLVRLFPDGPSDIWMFFSKLAFYLPRLIVLASFPPFGPIPEICSPTFPVN